MKLPTLVISGVNLVEGGTLTVLRDCVAAAARVLPEWRIVVMAHDPALITTSGVEVHAFPRVKSRWHRRVWLEWIGFKPLSRALDADLWLSLHDMTPRVHAKRQAVYCHNPAIFYRLSAREAFLEPKLLAFNLFYGALYGAFIRRNSQVIVQQQWLREEFRRRFGELPLVVAHPSETVQREHGRMRTSSHHVFVYPALARVFKNMEVLGRAGEILRARGVDNFEIRLTLSGEENRYARWLRSRFAATPAVRFIGRQDAQQMQRLYAEATAVVFPSKLETWGLPITEAKNHGLPLLVADAPYARETVGTYNAVTFFAPDRAESLADEMQALINGTWAPQGNAGTQPSEPFAPDWPRLLLLLTDGLGPSKVSDKPKPASP